MLTLGRTGLSWWPMAENGQENRSLVGLERAVGHLFARPELLAEALRHKSYTYEQSEPGPAHNERLEYLGDAVLELAVSEMLFRSHGRVDEGWLTRFRAALVNETSLARVARRIGLGEYVRLGRGEQVSGGSEKPSILGNALEAVLGAIFMDAGFEAAAAVVRRLWAPLQESLSHGPELKDYKTRLQELYQGRYRITPSYRVVGSDGPDHDRVFQVEVTVAGKCIGDGYGRSKKEAHQAAAKVALEALETEPAEGEDENG